MPAPEAQDPAAAAPETNLGGDPNAEMPVGDDPAMGDTGMETGADMESGDDSTASIIDQLSDDDKEAVRNYAKSLLNRDEAQPEDMAGMEEPTSTPAPGQGGQGVMMEITKGRLKKVQQKLHETFRSQEDDKEEADRVQKKVEKPRGKKSPFDSPLD